MKSRLRLEFQGIVQGVGFRPKLFQIADKLQLKGWILNNGLGVQAEFEGSRAVLENFLKSLTESFLPPVAIHSVKHEWLKVEGFQKLEIRKSETSSNNSTFIPADIRTCTECKSEIFQKDNRRYLYPFTSCTNCGPRYAVTKNLPFDREQTSFLDFKMCSSCQAEYTDSRHRRFHAQTNCCPDCGPQLSLCDQEGNVLAAGADVLELAQKYLLENKIIAVKGMGGFQLICRADSAEAVIRLRKKKHRPSKPFALMFPDLQSINEFCYVSDAEKIALESQAAPIVLLDVKSLGLPLIDHIAPGLSRFGVMLPTSGLHHLLFHKLDKPLVVTSGNISGEPICIDNDEALNCLKNITDYFVFHNYIIQRAVDDSVVQIVAQEQQVLRRARGFAPLPISAKCFFKNNSIEFKARQIIALGGHMKNTISISLGNDIVGSQHLGDLENEKSYLAFQQTIHDFQKVYSYAPQKIVCDLHPDYMSTRFAESLIVDSKDKSKTELQFVQHHYAHALSCVLDQNVNLPAMAVVWDGTGYGPESQIWGGEFLKIDRNGFSRAVSLRPFNLSLGEKSLRNPRLVLDQIKKSIQEDKQASFNCTSAGRLFDAVAALMGFNEVQSYEGEAAMKLQALAESADKIKNKLTDESTYSISLNQNILDWGKMIFEIENEVQQLSQTTDIKSLKQRENSMGQIALRFHQTLVKGILLAARHINEKRVVLSGGCFQNRLLTELTLKCLSNEGFEVFWHHQIPPNDGGISWGQILAAQLTSERKRLVKKRNDHE